jgi:hypothetical protein
MIEENYIELINNIKQGMIRLTSLLFDLLLTLRDNRFDDDKLNLESEFEKIFQNDYKPSYSDQSGTILSIIRDVDSIHEIVSKENKTWTDLYDLYNNFVDSQTSKAVETKEKRYQIACDFFSFVASMIIMQKRDTKKLEKTLESISSQLSDIEMGLSSEIRDDKQNKMTEIVKFVASLEKTIGNLIKVMNIEPAEILPSKNQE